MSHAQLRMALWHVSGQDVSCATSWLAGWILKHTNSERTARAWGKRHGQQRLPTESTHAPKVEKRSEIARESGAILLPACAMVVSSF